MKGFSPDFFDVLKSYSWPGNVREMIGVLDWTIARSLHAPTLFPAHLPPFLRARVVRDAFDNEIKTTGTENEAGGPAWQPVKWKDYRQQQIQAIRARVRHRPSHATVLNNRTCLF